MRPVRFHFASFCMSVAPLVLAPHLLPTSTSARPGPVLDTPAIDVYMADYLARTGLPGAAVVVTHGTRVVHTRGYGVGSDGRSVTTGTLFPIASLSKSMTALAVLQLVEQERLSLDTAVVRYLPDFVLADPRASFITVRQLLDHTSGLSDMTFREKSLWQPTSLQQAMDRLRGATLATAPGGAVHYHNPNYQVAARLVEVVSGEPFAEYLARHVLRPAGMQRSFTVATTRNVPELAMGHIGFYGSTIAVEEPYWFLEGSSGVVTTADDMAQWLGLQSNGGVSSSGTRVVSERSLAEMHGGDAASGRRGLGWSRREDEDGGPTRLEHSGWLFTSSASQVLLPESGYGVAVMANRGIGLGGDDADNIAKAVVAMIEGKQPTVGLPMGRILAFVFAALTLSTAALGILGIRRARSWAQRRTSGSLAGAALRLLPLAGWIVLFAFLPTTARRLSGRDASWLQYWLMAAPVLVWLAVSALSALVVIAARARQVLLLREVAWGPAADVTRHWE